MNHHRNRLPPPQLIAIDKLEKSPLNVRKTPTKAGIDEMKASILSHGLMQNLVVTAAGDGTYHVIAGGRRLAALTRSRPKASCRRISPCRARS